MQYGGRGPPHCPLWVSPLPAIEGAPLPAPSGGPEPHSHLPGQVLRIWVDPQAEDAVEMGRLYPHPGQLAGEPRSVQLLAPPFHIPFSQAHFHSMRAQTRFPSGLSSKIATSIPLPFLSDRTAPRSATPSCASRKPAPPRCLTPGRRAFYGYGVTIPTFKMRPASTVKI